MRDSSFTSGRTTGWRGRWTSRRSPVRACSPRGGEPGRFAQVRLSEAGAVEWPGEIDLCPDALYLELTGKPAEAVFPARRRVPTHA